MIAGHRIYIEKKAVSPRARDCREKPTAPFFRREDLEHKALPRHFVSGLRHNK